MIALAFVAGIIAGGICCVMGGFIAIYSLVRAGVIPSNVKIEGGGQ